MSLSIAISNAMSGLGASSRGTEVVSSNIANKSVAGYARRELAVSSSALGGVTVDGVRRMVSAGLLADDRLAQAASAHSGAIASFHGAVETALQTEDEAGSIGSLVAGLDTALAAATSDPASDTRLAQVADAAGALGDGPQLGRLQRPHHGEQLRWHLGPGAPSAPGSAGAAAPEAPGRPAPAARSWRREHRVPASGRGIGSPRRR